MLHNSIHLERIGDQCVTIAKLTKLAAELEPHARPRRGVARDGGPGRGDGAHRARRILARATSSGREPLVDLDELIDRTNRRVADKVLAIAHEPGSQEWGMRMIVVSRCLERVGDNAVDIGEQTAFLVTGEFHEFTDASH